MKNLVLEELQEMATMIKNKQNYLKTESFFLQNLDVLQMHRLKIVKINKLQMQVEELQ
jgi:hypothetical protein